MLAASDCSNFGGIVGSFAVAADRQVQILAAVRTAQREELAVLDRIERMQPDQPALDVVRTADHFLPPFFLGYGFLPILL